MNKQRFRKYFDPLSTKFDFVLLPKPSERDVFLNRNFLRLWMFLYTHGEEMSINPIIHKNTKVMNKGRCISHSRYRVEQQRKIIKEKYNNALDLQYTEGLATNALLSVHAWPTIISTRHVSVIEETREINIDHLQHVKYLGVYFDLDFMDWVRKVQEKNNYKDTLHYLGSGCCCLTYKPLLEGKLADYPMKNVDIEGAFDLLAKFAAHRRSYKDLYVHLKEENNA